jgi:hypothetical protein
MTTVSTTGRDPAIAPVLAAVAATGVVAVAVGAVVTWVEAEASGETSYLAGDLVGLSVMAVVGLVVVGLLDVWGLRGGEQRSRRLVIGLAVGAAVLLPVLWWSAVPLIMAASVLAVTAQVGRDRVPRAAVLVAVLVVAGVLALWTGSLLAELL